MKNVILSIASIAFACSAAVAFATGPAVIDFENIPVGSVLTNGQFGWYDWGTGGGGQFIVLSDSGSRSSSGPGSSSIVSNGPDSIHSVFMATDTVLMEWEVDLRRDCGTCNGQGPAVHMGRDLDGDGILENDDSSPADAGWEGLVGIKIQSDRVRIRYFTLDETGIRHQDSGVIEWIGYSSDETNVHCSVQIQNVSSHEMMLDVILSGKSGVIVHQQVPLDFIGPHRWDEINGTAIRTDETGYTVDNIIFSVYCPPNLADLNGDGLLNFFDISGFLLYFQLQDSAADFNGDGQFNFFDVSAFLTAFITGCP